MRLWWPHLNTLLCIWSWTLLPDVVAADMTDHVEGEVLEELCRHLKMTKMTLLTKDDGHLLARLLFADKSRMTRVVHDMAYLALSSSRRRREEEEEESWLVDMGRLSWDEVKVLTSDDRFGVAASSVFLLRSDHNNSIQPKFQINQRVFFLTLDMGYRLSEHYSVGGVDVRRDLAYFDASAGRFVTSIGVTADFAARRADFLGANLRTVVCAQAPYMFVDTSLEEEKVEKFPDGLQLSVLQPTQLRGIFHDLQVLLTFYRMHMSHVLLLSYVRYVLWILIHCRS